MDLPWFKRVGIFFIPVTLIGWVILLAAFAYAAYSFVEINTSSNSLGNTIINFFASLVIIIAVYSLIAFLTSRSKR